LDTVTAGGAGPERLAQVRQAVAAQDDDRAEQLLRTFEGPWSQEFLPLGDLELSFGVVDDDCYERVLDLDDATVTEVFGSTGARVRRRAWVSAVDDALIVELASEQPVDLRIRLHSELRTIAHAVSTAGISLLVETPVDGAPAHEPAATAHRWADDAETAREYDPVAAISVALSADAASVTAVRDAICVSGAQRVMVALTTETNARRWWQGVPSAQRDALRGAARARAEALVAEDAEALLRRHSEAAASVLQRSRLELGAHHAEPLDVAALLTDGDDRVLATVLYAFGRYLLFSSSRAGSPPANLQGIWNASMRPPWSSNYTININTQMNYWLAERTGLGEQHTPLLDLIARLSHTGRAVARRLYGARGWVAHHNTDPWGFALPVGDGHGAASWAFWPMGGLWLCDHLWQRWEYGRDSAELAERILPILREASAFALDWLVQGSDGTFATSPSTSPENWFVRPDGSIGSITVSSAMDLALIRATLERTLSAMAIVGAPGDDPLSSEIRAALPLIPAPGIAADGTLDEWGHGLSSQDPHHRHLSHLIGLFPLTSIDRDRDPELAAAARRTLDARGAGAMGWSWAWKIALRARLGDAEEALSLFREATRPFVEDPDVDAPVDGSRWGGLLPNLFSTHPPFQLDGNYGFAAALSEMLVGSGTGAADDPLRLLPALPSSWAEGALTGVRTRGGLAVDLRWQGGRLAELTLRDETGAAPTHVVIEFAGRRAVVPVGAMPVDVDALFTTDAGKSRS
jgi:alpha-L-fucosidase 2